MTFSPAYLVEAAKKPIATNYYMTIVGANNVYSKHPVIGLATKSLLRKLRFTRPSVRVDKSSTVLGQMSVNVQDNTAEDFLGEFFGKVMHEKEVELFIGFKSLGVADYSKVGRFKIREVDSGDGTTYTISATEAIDDLRIRIEQPTSALSADVTAGATSIPVQDVSVFDTPTSKVRIEDELGTYSAVTATALDPVSRGVDGSTADAHKEGAVVTQHRLFPGENPITFLLKLMISPGGGGPFDVLPFGAGKLTSTIAVASIESLRDDTKLAGDLWDFHFDAPIEDLLKFIEDEILFWTNTRIFTNLDGLIDLVSIGRLDISGANLIEVKDLVGTKPPVWKMSSRRIINEVLTQYDFDRGTQEFEKIEKKTDPVSIADFDTIPGPTFISSFIKSASGGAAIVADRISQFFANNAGPEPRLAKVKTFYDKQFFDIGDEVQCVDARIPNIQTGKRGINTTFEVLSRQYDVDRGHVTYEMYTNPFLNIRALFVAPSGRFTSVTSTSVFTLTSGEGVNFSAGFFVSLWLKDAGGGPIDTKEILTVVGDVVTLVSGFSVLPVVGTHVLRFADYDSVVDKQKQWGFVSDGTLNFADGLGPYQVQN